MITIGFCTVDRLGPLEMNLKDLGKQNIAGLPEVELLVVMNNSPRASHDVVDRVLPELPFKCRKVEERRQGANYGRNRIIEESKGDVVVMTDDDLERNPNWLQVMVNSFDNKEVSCVGGRIYPELPCPLPVWFKPRYDGIIVKYDLGNKPFFLTIDDPLPYGASMAFRRDVFDKIGPFRGDLSIDPRRSFTGGDTEYFVRALDAGLKILYQPAAVSRHPIEETRLTKSNVRRQFRTWGRSWARMNFERERNFPQLAGIPRHIWRNTLGQLAQLASAIIRTNRPDVFLSVNELIYFKEFIGEYRQLVRTQTNSGALGRNGN